MEWNRIVDAIDEVVVQVRAEYVINDMVPREHIFGILEQYCTVLYYPIEGERNIGFHIKKLVNDRLEDFVYINTAKPLGEQVFAAAHELGHIWSVAEKVWERIECEESLSREMEESITNRFAAKLLMPRDVFRKTFYSYLCPKTTGDGLIEVGEDELVRIMVHLMSDFLVPYNAVRKRLHETKLIPDVTKDALKKNQKRMLEKVAIYSGDVNSGMERATMKKTIPGIRTLIEKAETKECIEGFIIGKIKDDFDIQDIIPENEVLKIQLGENADGENGSIS